MRYNGVVEPAQSLIDRITYTASLATSLQGIDSLLEPVRFITARVNSTDPLQPRDRAELEAVQQQLEHYLVTQEKQRYFTPDSLQLQIEQHMQGYGGRHSRRQLNVVIAVSALVAIAAACLPMLQGPQQRGRVAGSVLFSSLTIGAAWLFLSALPAFTSRPRHAFQTICAGVTILGLSLLEQPIVHVLAIQSRPLVVLLYPVPILIAAVLFHIGNVRYARLLNVHSRWTTTWPVVATGTLLSLVAWFTPHPTVTESEIIHDLATVIWSWVLVMPIGSAIVLRKAIRLQPELYRPSVRALFQAMIPIVGVTSYLFILNMAGNVNADNLFVYGLFVIVIVMSLFLVRSGYIFNKVSRY